MKGLFCATLACLCLLSAWAAPPKKNPAQEPPKPAPKAPLKARPVPPGSAVNSLADDLPSPTEISPTIIQPARLPQAAPEAKPQPVQSKSEPSHNAKIQKPPPGPEAPASSLPQFEGPASYDVEDEMRSREPDKVDVLAEVPKSPPMTYVIQPGDTLWGICTRFISDPWFWPKLWNRNQYIKNPHLIFPGNLVRFFQGEGEDGAAAPLIEVYDKEEDADIAEARLPKAVEQRPDPLQVNVSYEGLPLEKEDEGEKRSFEVVLHSFYAEVPPKQLGVIKHSPKEGVILSTSDQVFVTFEDSSPISAGDIFSVYTIAKEIDDPEAWFFGSMGYQIALRGTIQVISLKGEYVVAKVSEGYEEIERGNLVTSYINPYLTVAARQADYYHETTIISSENHKRILGEREVVYIYGGKEDRVRPGDTYEIVTQGDIITGKSKDLPSIVKGKLIVLQVYPRISQALVIDTTKPVEVGDKIITTGMFTRAMNPAQLQKAAEERNQGR